MHQVVGLLQSNGEARFCGKPDASAAQMQHPAHDRWNAISNADLIAGLRMGRAPVERSVAIIFDDGTECTFEGALPVFARYGFPASVYMVSGVLGGRNEWVVLSGYPARRTLSGGPLCELDAAFIEVGSQTANHVRLATVPLSVALDELRNRREELEGLLGKPSHHFACCYGNFNADVREAVLATGCTGACSTRWGRNGVDAGPLAFKLAEVMGGDGLLQLPVKLRIGTQDVQPWSVPRAAVNRSLQGFGTKPGGAAR